ncbi:peptide deformylase [Rhodobacteraceae bacterium]|nr:peptide deformylase [Paracoccaceae bacterium]
MTHSIVPWPDKRLRTPANPVDKITDDIRTFWDKMIRIMDAMPGYGLAATQLGQMQRLAVVDCSKERGQAIRLANPKIIASSTDMFDWDEASPNLPGHSARISRPAEVTVSFMNADGEPQEQDFTNLWATSVQHQIDHLNGKMYFERLSRTKRDMFLKKLRKIS